MSIAIRLDRGAIGNSRFGREIAYSNLTGYLMARVLVVEDDLRLARVIEDWLAAEDHSVELVASGPAALERLSLNEYDILILDWALPGLTGLDVCKQYRSSGGTAAILILTGKQEIERKEEGLDAGADDYLTKPFHMRELSARMRALLRRSRQIRQTVIQIGDLVLDAVRKKVTKAGRELRLMPREYALLEFFMQHPNEVFSSDTILDKVWSESSDAAPDTVRVHITKLRSKIDSDGAPSLIKTLHRQGYKLEPPGVH